MRGKKWTKEVEAMEAVNEDEPAVFDSDLKAVGGLVHPAERNGVRTLSWAEGGVSPSILRGPDGLVGLPKPPGASWDVFSSHESGMPEGHPEGGDISKCPFAALVMDTYSANPAAAGVKKPAPKRDISFSGSAVGSAVSGSKAGSGSILSAALMNGTGDDLGLGHLNRDEWTVEELTKRSQMLPTLRITTEQLDGTIKPKFSHVKQRSKVQNMEDFGTAFYEELFDHAPEIRDELFADKPTEVLAVKLGVILHEVVRLLSIDSPRELAGVIAEMGLKHIEYGLEAKHVQPFITVMLATIKMKLTEKGFKWMAKNKRAWSWALKEVTTLLINAVDGGRPKINILKRTWLFMAERMHEETTEKEENRKRLSDDDGATDDSGSEEGEEGELLGGEEASRSNLGMRAAQKSAMTLSRKAMTTAMSMMSHIATRRKRPKGSPQAGMSRHKPGDLFQTWRKKDAHAEGNPDYLNGRLRIGQTFLEVFAARNLWAVEDFGFGKSPSHAEKMGLALELIVNSATKPKVLQHKLRVLALGHAQMGIKSAMFPRFGEALFEFLDQVLGAYNAWDEGTEEAWRWMWNIVQSAFAKHLDSADELAQTVSNSWDYITNTLDLADISAKFFSSLFQQVPELQKLFVKPTKMQTVMLGKALDLIVRSLTDTHVLDVELQGIAMRHIKYDINQGHLDTFGQILMATFADMLGADHWDEDVQGAWLDVYSHIAEVFGHVISSGRNLVSKALATNNTDDLKAALDLTPRRYRAKAALEIEVDDTVVLPITWTISEGQFAMTDALLRDVLAIRGDRSAYYYGRKLLYEMHPWIVHVLTEKAPKLLPTFLDGHMWTSRHISKGHRRVNFYIKELYGDPEKLENHSAYNTALGILTTRLPASELEVFAHPVIVFLTDLKWKQFAKKDFTVLVVINILNTACTTSFMLLGAQHPLLSFALAVAQLMLCLIRMYFYLVSCYRQIRSGTGATYNLLRKSFTIPYAMHDAFLWINVTTAVFSLALFAETFDSDVFSWKTELQGKHKDYVSGEQWAASHDYNHLLAWADLAAFTAGLSWIQLIELFKLTHQLSALLFALVAVMGDVMRFAVVLLVWQLGFSLTLYWLKVSINLSEGDEIHHAMDLDLNINGMHHATVVDLIYYVVMSSLALTGIVAILNSNWIVRGVYAVCVICTVVVLLNLLVSTMVSTYEVLQHSFYELAVKCRAELVVVAEERSLRSRRSKFFESLYFDDRLDFEEEDDGPSGGVQTLMPAETLKHPSFNLLDRVERYVGSTRRDDPWDPNSIFSKGITADETSGLSTENAAHHKMLTTLVSDIVNLSSELFNIKRELKIGDDGTQASSKYAESEASSAASKPLSDIDAVAAYRPKKPDAAIAKQSNLSNPPTDSVTSIPAESPRSTRVGPGREITAEEMAMHSDPKSLWLAVDGVVRDCTALLDFHPGGRSVLLSAAGDDCSDTFHASHIGSSYASASAGLKKFKAVGLFSRKI